MSKQQRLVIVISILASFVAFLDGSVIGVALPAVTRELGGGLPVQQWVNDAYLITLGSLILIAGSFSDIFGRKKVLVGGLIGFAVTSLLCAIAPTSLVLIIARGLQGAAAALLVPSSLALIISAFSGAKQAKAIGTWTAWTGIAFIIGPLVGGVLVDVASWRYVFVINLIPIAITLWFMRSLELEDKPKKASIDVLGGVLSAAGLSGVVYALIEQARYGWSSPIIYGTFTVGLLLLATFVYHEYRSSRPMTPLPLFKVRNFSAGNIATFFIYGGLSLLTFVLVIFLQQVAGYSALAAGAATIPITLLLFFLSPQFGALSGKYGPRFFMAVGPFIIALGALLMLLVTHQAPYLPYLLAGILLFGLGLSITVAPLTGAILGSITPDQAGIGSAINNAVARIAGLLSIALIGTFIGTTIDLDGFYTAIMLSAAMFAVGGIVSAIGIRNETIKTGG